MQHDPTLYNEDLAPVPQEKRSWGLYNYASLWVAMSVCIPTYMLSSGLIAGGMSWWQAIGTILLGNLIVLIPMLLNAHAGAKYGIPFPVFVRASFGVRGANIPAVLRALVACGWFGIQTWIGGQAIFSMLKILWPAAAASPAGAWVCFFAFWALNIAVIWRGIETIKFLEGIGAPFMLGIGLLLLWWITGKAGGLGPVLSAPSKFHSTAEFLRFFIPSLTGMVGFWATVALNIPDFTRYAKSQKAQMWGQALGLPAAMTLYSFIGVAVTSASAVIFGEPIWDPVVLLGKFNQPVVASIALVALLVATLNTNVAANVVSPSNDFSNLNPRLISFRTGGLITGVIGVLMMPWKLMTDFSSYIFGWLVGYSGSARTDRRRHDRRLFPRSPRAPQAGRSLSPQRHLRIRKWNQPARRRSAGRRHRRSPPRTRHPAATALIRLRMVRRLRSFRRRLRNADAARRSAQPNADER